MYVFEITCSKSFCEYCFLLRFEVHIYMYALNFLVRLFFSLFCINDACLSEYNKLCSLLNLILTYMLLGMFCVYLLDIYHQ